MTKGVWLALLLLSGWACPSQAKMHVVGLPLPYLPALEAFVVQDGQLDWDGTEDDGPLQQQATRFWWYAVLYRETFGETMQAFSLREWDRWPLRAILYVTNVDLTTQSMECTATVPVTPRARHVLTVLGCVWGQG